MEFLNRSVKLKYYSIFLLLNAFLFCTALGNNYSYNWIVKETNFTRLCSTKRILTINGMFPGPALYVHKGDFDRYINCGGRHGVKQPRNPWSDGPEYITQCPIKPGANFSYEIIFSSEEGTLWWHAHSDWSRATVHGPIFVYPKSGTTYPFAKPHAEFPVVMDVMEIIQDALATGGEPNQSDAFTINGQPGDLYPCSKPGTFKAVVDYGKTYLLRVINAILNEEMFLAVANHTLTVVGMDGAYIKPLKTSYIMITPGQTMDVLVTANQSPSHYYLAARAYAGLVYDNTTTTAIFRYNGSYTAPKTPALPNLPNYTDTDAATNFTTHFKALASKEHPIDVPKSVDKRIIITISINTIACANNSCDGPNNSRLASSLNNISFVTPEIDILQAYYRRLKGVYDTDFPREPPYVFNYTADVVPDDYLTPEVNGTKALVLKHNANVEIVFQGTNVLASAENHPMHLHGFSFYVVGSGFGNFNNETDPKRYNLVDPPEMNTVGVPTNGWAAIRFKADNPGKFTTCAMFLLYVEKRPWVWFMHCHLEKHASWGMETVVIVRNGKTKATRLRRPPSYLNPC
ncbi:hypothetical protein RJ640_006730 [Escallonia rubra]|uniref:Laccase n=1 Tax=Escallonia rubra TaxID=112253 RepID=A0AA88RGL9_9ASTE|nr:hypothetical protein RJ640_006730 [Escallonia rubra]